MNQDMIVILDLGSHNNTVNELKALPNVKGTSSAVVKDLKVTPIS